MRPTRRSFILTASLLLLAPAVAQAGLFDWFNRVKAHGYDAITTPNHAVDCQVKFERWFTAGPDFNHRATQYTAPAAGASQTDGDGTSHLTVTAARTGVYPISAFLAGHQNSPGTSRMFVFDPARPAVIFDIDGTLSDLPSWEVVFRGASAPTFPGAVQLARDLARDYDVIYLTARDEALDGSTRAFLARHGFPDGPVLFNDLGLFTAAERAQLSSSHHGEFKLRVIQGLQARGVNVRIGIGNAETDGYAYENAGLQSFLNTSATGTGSSFRFSDYAILRLELVARGLLP